MCLQLGSTWQGQLLSAPGSVWWGSVGNPFSRWLAHMTAKWVGANHLGTQQELMVWDSWFSSIWILSQVSCISVQYGGSVLRVSVPRTLGSSCVAFYDPDPCHFHLSHKSNQIQAKGTLTPPLDEKECQKLHCKKRWWDGRICWFSRFLFGK